MDTIDCFKILNFWKSHFTISEDEKNEYANWAKETVSQRVDAIVSNQYRKSYSKAGYLVCILDECLENLKLQNKGDIINLYLLKYYRYPAFKKEIEPFKVNNVEKIKEQLQLL